MRAATVSSIVEPPGAVLPGQPVTDRGAGDVRALLVDLMRPTAGAIIAAAEAEHALPAVAVEAIAKLRPLSTGVRHGHFGRQIKPVIASLRVLQGDAHDAARLLG